MIPAEVSEKLFPAIFPSYRLVQRTDKLDSKRSRHAS